MLNDSISVHCRLMIIENVIIRELTQRKHSNFTGFYFEKFSKLIKLLQPRTYDCVRFEFHKNIPNFLRRLYYGILRVE